MGFFMDRDGPLAPAIGDCLKEAGISVSRVRSEVEKLQGKEGKKVELASGDMNFQALITYRRDLVEQAGKLDPVIGRDEQIRSVPYLMKSMLLSAAHPWIRSSSQIKVPLDILIFRLVKSYTCSSSLRKSALRALSKTLAVDELIYLKEQFALLEPNKNGCITLENIKMALMKNVTDAMKESRIQDFLVSLSALKYRRMDFDEFCAAALSVHQLEGLHRWSDICRNFYFLNWKVYVAEPSVADTIRIQDRALVVAAQLSSRYITGGRSAEAD
ncbi:chaperone protein ClpB1-like [Asparagus officinalis]|uniref:chaperone protein ClpB1-like n=1 Tax=Asparagus officinalis TaxID=4686 RepID=UPI00098E04E7|nr:chaperone protein ClpB1-like [Asparagus officinalis]